MTTKGSFNTEQTYSVHEWTFGQTDSKTILSTIIHLGACELQNSKCIQIHITVYTFLPLVLTAQ